MKTASPLRVGVLVSVATLGFAAVVGLIAVIDADGVQSAVGVGLTVGVTTFAAGGTIACSLSCLVRNRLEWVSVAALGIAGVGLDLLAVAAWQGIDSEAYGKATAVAFVWTLFALLGLGLTIAVGEMGQTARAVWLAAIVSTVAAGAIATWLIVASGEGRVFDDPLAFVGDDGLLRALGAAIVLLSSLWFSALAVSRLDRATR